MSDHKLHLLVPLPAAELYARSTEVMHKDGWKSPWNPNEKMSVGLQRDRIKFFGLNGSEREEAELSKVVIAKIEESKKSKSDAEYNDIAQDVLKRIQERASKK